MVGAHKWCEPQEESAPGAPPIASRTISVWLAEQREDALLCRIRLRQRRDAGLVQDGKPREVGDHRRDIRGADAIFGSGQVLGLVADDVAGCLQAVDVRAEGAAQTRYVRDGRVDQ